MSKNKNKTYFGIENKNGKGMEKDELKRNLGDMEL